MKRLSILLLSIASIGLLTFNCNKTAASNETNDSTSTAKTNDTEALTKELEDAFTKMFENTTFTKAIDYFRTDVSDDYVMIGADGIVETKEELLADLERLKMLEKLTFKFFDQKTRIYGDVGILNGRSQAFLDGNYVAEFLYTAIFVKENGTWMYTSWQGTMSIHTPPPVVIMEKN